MGMDFDINVNLKTIGKSDVESAEKSLEKILSYNGKTVTLNLKFNDGNGADFTKYFSNIEKLAQSAGKGIGTSLQQGIKSVKFNGNSEDFLKQFISQEHKNLAEAKKIATVYDTTNSIALKAINARNKAQIKADEERVKQQEKSQSELDAIENARLKSVENARKREEQLNTSQNKAINKALNDNYINQQKEEIRLQKEREKTISSLNIQLERQKKNLSSSISKNEYANTNDIKKASEYLDTLNKVDLNKWESPAIKMKEITSQVEGFTTTLSASHKTNLDKINEEIAQEEKLKNIREKEYSSYNNPYRDAYQSIGQKSNIQKQMSEYYKELEISSAKEAEKIANQASKFDTINTKLQTLKSNLSKETLGTTGFEKVSGIIDKAEQSVKKFNSELAKGSNVNLDNLTFDLKEVNSLTKKATTEYEKLSSKASAIDQQSFINKLNKYAEANPRAIKAGQAQWNEMFNSAQSASMTAGQLKDAELNLKQFDNEMQAAGKTGKNFFDEFKRGFIKIGEFAYTYGAIQGVFNNISSSINELKDINTIVTEISKAADVPVKQLKDLETNSFSVASKYGQKASDYLLGVQEMTRAGYSNTSGMAELSTLAQSAGDMTAELANQYLIASDMAFGYGGNVEKLNSLLDSQNQINKIVC